MFRGQGIPRKPQNWSPTKNDDSTVYIMIKIVLMLGM